MISCGPGEILVVGGETRRWPDGKEETDEYLEEEKKKGQGA